MVKKYVKLMLVKHINYKAYLVILRLLKLRIILRLNSKKKLEFGSGKKGSYLNSQKLLLWEM